MKLCLFNPGIENHRGSPSSNLGDLLIEKAVRRELSRVAPEAEVISISTQVYPEARHLAQILRCPIRMVGGTNLLSSNMDAYRQWKITPVQAGLIRKAILLGVGWWQYQADPNAYTRRLLRLALNGKGLHSARDSYTEKKLHALGIKNVVNTGCPTMWPLLDARPEHFPRHKADEALLMLTDYFAEHVDNSLYDRITETLLRNYRNVYYWPQGRKDLELIAKWSGKLTILEPTVPAFEKFLHRIEPFDYVGTRLHGGIMCLLARRRSLIVEIDNRAREIALDTGLPTINQREIENLERWIQGPAETVIKMRREPIERWRLQFQHLLRRRRPCPEFVGAAHVQQALQERSSRPVLVNLGCGLHFHPSWVNLDFQPRSEQVIAQDLRKPLSFPVGSCAAIYHSHVLEHFSRPTARRFLQECYRALTPGGILRIAVPDLEAIARLYLQYLNGALEGEPEASERHEWMTLELLDQLVREQSGGEVMKFWRQSPMPVEDFVVQRAGLEVTRFLEANRGGTCEQTRVLEDAPDPDEESVARFRALGEVHKWMYDRVSLRRLLENLGYVEIKVCDAATSSIPGFSAYCLDTTPDGSVRKPDSLFMEARKPATKNILGASTAPVAA